MNYTSNNISAFQKIKSVTTKDLFFLLLILVLPLFPHVLAAQVISKSLKNKMFLNDDQNHAFNFRTAAPTNDDCTTAQTVNTDGTCYPGTTVAANDSWQGT